MKKILGILFLLIVIAIGICAYFFPGIPYRYKCTHEFKLLDSIYSEVPADLAPLPADYADYSNLGIRITAWNDMEAVRTEDKNEALWENEDKSHTIHVKTETLGDNYDFLDRTGITHEALNSYCKKVGKTPPETNHEFVRLIMSLTMEDFDIHDMKNAKTFYKLMSLKNEEFMGLNCPVRYYSADGVGYKGYMKTVEMPSEKTAVINIYPDKNNHRHYTIELSVTDWNEILAISESIKLTE